MTPVLEMTEIGMRFPSPRGEVKVVEDFSVSIDKGRFVCLVGPNGCGKSSLLHIASGFLRPSRGSIRVGGRTVMGPSPEHPLIPQGLALFDWMTVLGNVTFGLRARGEGRVVGELQARPWLDRLGLREFEESYPFELSGGMKQKLALARVMILDPAILLLDEPFASMDALTRERLQEEIAEIATSGEKTVLMSTHSIDEAVFLSDEVIVMTRRPGTVAATIKVETPRPRVPAFRVENRFLATRGRVWDVMRSWSKSDANQ